MLHIACNLKCGVPNKIPIVFRDESNYDHYFVMKVLAEEFLKLIAKE